jgi:hypothetical protein
MMCSSLLLPRSELLAILTFLDTSHNKRNVSRKIRMTSTLKWMELGLDEKLEARKLARTRSLVARLGSTR